MALHPAREGALLTWINSLDLGEPVARISDLQDGRVLLKLVHKLKGEEPSQAPVQLRQAERLAVISDFLRSVCDGQQGVSLSGDGTSEGRELDLAKTALLLCYYGLVNNELLPKVDLDTELQMATMFRHVQHGASSFSLSESVDNLLTASSVIHSSFSSRESAYSEGTPTSARSRSPLFPFLELDTVASSSFVGSPIQEIMNTPQVQLRRLRKELAREGDVRDELEQELAERMAIISEKERQISQLQSRLEHLLRDQEELEKDHKSALLKLQQKNEGLIKRVHEVVKQCQELKTDNMQKEKKMDEFMEENGVLAVQVRNAFAQLARAEEEVSKLTQAHESSQADWENRRNCLQRELSQAVTDRECLNELILILQGKISVLQDELSRVPIQLQEKGENMGPIMEREKLKQELADLTFKMTQHEETIACLEKEKLEIERSLSEEKGSFEREILRLQGLITNLQQSINSIRAEREAQELSSREKQELLTAHIATLEKDVARLQQLEAELKAEMAECAELRKQREELEAKVASLEDTVNMLCSKCEGMKVESEAQQEALDVLRADLQNAQDALMEYERKLVDHQTVVEENTSLHARISALDYTVVLLQNDLDTEKKRGEEILAAKEQQTALMEEKFQKQEEKAHEMFAELQTLSQELRKMKQQKLHAESCIEKLTQEGRALAAGLTEERDQVRSQLERVKKAKDESESELQHIISEHQSNISRLQCEFEGAVDSLKKSESELLILKEKLSSKDEELLVQQQKLATLQNESNLLQTQLLEEAGNSQKLSEDVASKDNEMQRLSRELHLKEEEIQSLKVSIQTTEAKSTEMRDILQREVEEQRLAVANLNLQLAEAERLISEKDKALQDLVQQLNHLKEELSTEKERAATSKDLFRASKEHHEIKEQMLQFEVTELRQEIDRQLRSLDGLLTEIKSLKEEVCHQQDRTQQVEQDNSVLNKTHKTLEENFAQLQSKLVDATTLATERQSELLALQKDAEHQETLRAKAQEIEEAERKVLEREVAELQAEVLELTRLASERETMLVSLAEKMKEQEDFQRKLLQESEEALQVQLEKVTELQGQLDAVTHQFSAKNELLEATKGKLEQMEVLCQEKEALVGEACQAKEVLEKMVTELCSKQKQDFHKYQQELESLQKDNEQLALQKSSLQNECQSLQTENKDKQESLDVLKADLQNTKDEYRKDLESLTNEREHLSSVNHSITKENKEHQKALDSLKADLQNIQDGYQKEVGALQEEKEHLSSVNQSLQNECKNLQIEIKERQEAHCVLRADLQSSQVGYQQQLDTLRKETEHLSLVNQSLQSECQSLHAEVKGQKESLNILESDLQITQDSYQQELETLRKEKENLSLIKQSLQSDCQNLQEENKGLQNTQEGYVKDLETLKNEKMHLSSVNQSLQNECQSLHAEVKGQKEALNTLQNSQEENQKEMQALQKDKENLSSINQSLQSECQSLDAEVKGQKEALNTLQNSQEGYQKDIESLQKDKENLSSVNQSLQNECQSLHAEVKGQKEALNTLQNSQEENQKEIEALQKDKENLSSVNQSLQNECQSLHAEVKGQKEALNTLQNSQEENQKEIEALQKDKENLSSNTQSLQSECQSLHAEVKGQKDALDTLQNSQEEYQKEMKALQKEKEDASLMNQSLQNECQSLQAELKEAKTDLQNIQEGYKKDLEILQKEKEKQQQALGILKADLQNTQDGTHQELEIIKKEKECLQTECQNLLTANKEQQEALNNLVTDLQNAQDGYQQELRSLNKENEHLSSVNQSLKSECQDLKEELKGQQAVLDILKSDLQDTVDRYQKEQDVLQKEKKHLSSLNQSLQRECEASQRLGAELELKLQEQRESIHALKEVAQQSERQHEELQEQLKLKIEAVEHYKSQLEIAKTHYNGKKQLLVEEQEARQALRASLETSESEVKALKAELKLASMELEKSKILEKNLLVKVKSLETQLDYADRQLREPKKQAGNSSQVQHRESVYLKVPAELQNTSADSLELDLDDSLNTAGKPSEPGESSTPLVRSSERLAAKRRAQDAGSLETLYFTPMNQRGKRDGVTHQKLESSITSLGDLTLDSAKKTASSVRRRRTTQVINITMTKKTPSGGGQEAEESFYSLHTTKSQPNLASQKTRPVSLEVYEEPTNSNDKLLSLPGYRRSNVHAPPRATSTFCVGAEYEPEHVADDWMRIAELQSRNKNCLPHLKSSYPLESRPSLCFSTLPVTDEDVRFGDPEETIRRVSMVPGHILESLPSHRLSLAPPPANRDHTSSQPQRYTMLPSEISTGAAAHRSSQQLSRGSAKTHEVRNARSPLATKRPASQLPDQDTPEAKKLASCFPRPATPKNRNLRSTVGNSQNRPPSPADRRQSMAFVIDNTPKKAGRVDSRLQRGINKLRNSARKSPAATAAMRLGRGTTGRSPLVDRALRKSPRIASTKSPKIPNSAKKLMKFRMKV